MRTLRFMLSDAIAILATLSFMAAHWIVALVITWAIGVPWIASLPITLVLLITLLVVADWIRSARRRAEQEERQDAPAPPIEISLKPRKERPYRATIIAASTTLAIASCITTLETLRVIFGIPYLFAAPIIGASIGAPLGLLVLMSEIQNAKNEAPR